jgi:hypothetical protein
MFRRGIEYQECWREGYLFLDLQDQLTKITREKDALEKSKKMLMKRLKSCTFLNGFTFS